MHSSSRNPRERGSCCASLSWENCSLQESMPVRLAPGPSRISSDGTHPVDGCVASESMEKPQPSLAHLSGNDLSKCVKGGGTVMVTMLFVTLLIAWFDLIWSLWSFSSLGLLTYIPQRCTHFYDQNLCVWGYIAKGCCGHGDPNVEISLVSLGVVLSDARRKGRVSIQQWKEEELATQRPWSWKRSGSKSTEVSPGEQTRAKKKNPPWVSESSTVLLSFHFNPEAHTRGLNHSGEGSLIWLSRWVTVCYGDPQTLT